MRSSKRQDKLNNKHVSLCENGRKMKIGFDRITVSELHVGSFRKQEWLVNIIKIMPNQVIHLHNMRNGILFN